MSRYNSAGLSAKSSFACECHWSLEQYLWSLGDLHRSRFNPQNPETNTKNVKEKQYTDSKASNQNPETVNPEFVGPRLSN